MEQKELFELMARFEKSNITTIKINQGDFYLEMEKATVAAVPAVAPAPVVAAQPVAQTEPVAEVAPGEVVKAPLVGTFYAAPAPDQAPFVTVGQTVSKGQALCLIEAMKTMNEISAPCDLVVEEILVTDGELVPFGGAILRYRHV